VGGPRCRRGWDLVRLLPVGVAPRRRLDYRFVIADGEAPVVSGQLDAADAMPRGIAANRSAESTSCPFRPRLPRSRWNLDCLPVVTRSIIRSNRDYKTGWRSDATNGRTRARPDGAAFEAVNAHEVDRLARHRLTVAPRPWLRCVYEMSHKSSDRNSDECANKCPRDVFPQPGEDSATVPGSVSPAWIPSHLEGDHGRKPETCAANHAWRQVSDVVLAESPTGTGATS
jgi:hypothetical protein